jgi:phage protein D
MPPLTLTRQAGDQHRYHAADREAYTGVRAYWHDPKQARQVGVLVGQGSNAKRLREGHATEADARAAAQAEWQRIQRGAATFELTLGLGLPGADAQSPLAVAGFKPEIDGTDWLVTRVTHRISESGFTTRLEAQRRS